MGTKLTKAQIDRIKPGTKDEHYWDAETRGFGLRVSPTGRMTFFVQSRVSLTGKEIRITIGAFGVFTVEQAREVAREHLRTMRQGQDPRQLKRQEAAMQVTLAQVAQDYIVARGSKLKPTSQKVITRHIETSFAKWANLPVTKIRHEMVRARYKQIVEGGLHGKKGAPGYLEHWHRQQSPHLAKRLRVVQQARTKLQASGNRLFAEMDKAVGVYIEPGTQRRLTARQLRAATDESMKAFSASR